MEIVVSIFFFLLIIIGIAVAIGIYGIPTIIAFTRNHKNKTAILALNILLGWTFLGWVACLVWSLTNDQSNQQTIN
ncbi:superinfection immunity protein [Salicibibacter cibarius]|uniref:Superinfection immunity protein n=1 Tax=Salicibibacter cibarius TaxID=2743000 RepID=A0A7T6Z6C4_9BACI|nr:superinfection immunity protein [Salicibibacter cibarius]QQK77618.1 superinfection immunity protein [Salicibibacter cibarius]